MVKGPEPFVVVFSLRGAKIQLTVYNTSNSYPKGPCAQIVSTLGPMYLRQYFKAKVYTIWIHGPLGVVYPSQKILACDSDGRFGAGAVRPLASGTAFLSE